MAALPFDMKRQAEDARGLLLNPARVAAWHRRRLRFYFFQNSLFHKAFPTAEQEVEMLMPETGPAGGGGL